MTDKVQKIREYVERIQLYTQSEVLKQVLDYVDEVQKEEIPPKFPIISSKEELKQKPFKVEKGKWYVCIKDYHDKNCTFTKGKKYKSDKDGFLVDDEDKDTFERKIWEEDACEYFRPIKCMYTEYNYTDEDRKVLCEDCKEKCEYNKKEEHASEELGEYINKLSKQFPEVSFAKLSRIAVRVAKWQKEQDQSTIELAEEHAYFAGRTKTIDEIKEALLSEVLPCFMHGGEADEVVAKLDEVLNQKK